ncbi:serine/threonine-protein kinase [Streptomyces sp. NPDC005438]|uniref:serine/threonine-protein kinase n=1 Tax=Streptomyces sp. NPDC005438 TaxID=3156880 RepID=UPI0033B5435F
MDAATGDALLAGRYQLGPRLGRGGMGVVWRAEDQLLGRRVAVKELRWDVEGPSASTRERALREARAVAQLKHPHILVLHDVVEQDDRPWIVMELVEGRSLAEELADGWRAEPERAARIALELLGALRAAHEAGVLHRDLKPANVLIENGTGRVVLTDFGIAQVAGVTSTVTEPGAFVGSPEYTSPERMVDPESTGPSSDLWSLGVLLCTLLHGSSPFHRGAVTAVLYAVVHEELVLPPELGPLRPVVEGLLRRDPGARLTAPEVERLLTDVLESGRTEGPTRRSPEGPGARPPARRGRGRVVAGVVAGTLVAGLVAGGVWWDTTREPPGSPTARESAGEGSASPGSGERAREGFRWVSDPLGFRTQVPEGYVRSAEPPRVFYYSRGRTVRVGFHVKDVPPDGSLAEMRRAHSRGPRDYPGYREGRVSETTQRQRPAAQWEFTWNGGKGGGGPRHTVDRSWVENGKLYDVWVSAPVDRWAEGRRCLDTVLDNFRRIPPR